MLVVLVYPVPWRPGAYAIMHVLSTVADGVVFYSRYCVQETVPFELIFDRVPYACRAFEIRREIFPRAWMARPPWQAFRGKWNISRRQAYIEPEKGEASSKLHALLVSAMPLLVPDCSTND